MDAFGWTGLVADLALVGALVLGVYYRRHRRREMVVPYIGLNVGVFAVVSALLGTEVGVGVGFGLFGVLSIIRLRSSEISHGDVCYYFSSLSIGLVCAMPLPSVWTGPLLGLFVVAVMAVIDQPLLHRRHRRERVVLERVYGSRVELDARLAELLGAESIVRVETVETDLVRDAQTVEVSYRVAAERDGRRRPVPVGRGL
ncbi:DUF4956 domain-containing protein [Glycomyces paridis]|uniref:DUF4956 domain-containing protein n=1 Tax=Glycomyces paridis TaxID=2126555 RepID=A0A4S8PD69_9ACTN|nr:DUF4956 domain-containing protein [Glycomyces paridis]THV26214.1 DUF4956 domain-containing protein [Glycomyces paridis]